jgi:hypothetical protein
MDNPEKLATLDTQDTGRRQTKQKTQHRKLKRWRTLTPPKTRGWTQSWRQRVHASYKTLVMLLIKAICVGQHYAQTSTNNVNKTRVLQQTTGGKDEPNIVFMWISYRTSQHWTKNVNTHNRTTQKAKKMSNTDLTNNWGELRCSRRLSSCSCFW